MLTICCACVAVLVIHVPLHAAWVAETFVTEDSGVNEAHQLIQSSFAVGEPLAVPLSVQHDGVPL